MNTEQKPNNIDDIVTCPICGKEAEQGCLYGADRNALRWIDGEPSLLKNLKTGVGGGEIIGKSSLLKGSHVKGVRCQTCKRIIIDID